MNAVKDGRGHDQIEMDRTRSESEYSFLQFVISKRQTLTQVWSKDQLDQVVACYTKAADRLHCAVQLTSIVTVCCRTRITDQLRGPSCKRSSARRLYCPGCGAGFCVRCWIGKLSSAHGCPTAEN